MQAAPPPPAPPRPRFGLFLVGAAVICLLVGGIAGYLLGASGIGHATLAVDVANDFGSNLTVQVTVNGALASTATLASGASTTVTVPVAYATANGATFDVAATTTQGPHDSQSVFVNAPQTYVVNLRLG